MVVLAHGVGQQLKVVVDGHEKEQGGQFVHRLEVVFGPNHIVKGGPKQDHIVFVHVTDAYVRLEVSWKVHALELVGECPCPKASVEGWPDIFVQVDGHLYDQVTAAGGLCLLGVVVGKVRAIGTVV